MTMFSGVTGAGFHVSSFCIACGHKIFCEWDLVGSIEASPQGAHNEHDNHHVISYSYTYSQCMATRILQQPRAYNNFIKI